MKKILFSFLAVATIFIFVSCDEETTNPITPTPTAKKGGIIITSTPTGAAIFLNGAATGKVTPDTLKDLTAGQYTVKLTKTDYKDTTLAVITIDSLYLTRAITLTANPILEVSYSNIQIYEQSSSNFSGLKLSTGTKVSSGGTEADVFLETVDIKSQDQRNPAVTNPRVTYFDNTPTATNLLDGVASNTWSATTWTKSKARSSTTYSFLYTKEGNYVKFKCTSFGGATGPSDPDRWVIVSYKYNQTVGDKRFKNN
jgi:hypothetical protein